VDLLCNIATYGTRIGYEGSRTRIRRANHGSAYANVNIINESLQKEIAKGRIKPLSSLPDYFFCSPIGLVPKKADGVQTGWRLIFDLSCPEGRSVNDGIPEEYGAIHYESLAHAMALVENVGENALLVKRDLKSAFRYIPVSPLDYWCLIFEWNGIFYIDTFLPFGLRTAPRIFNLFSEAIHWVLETKYGWSVTHYLDDFFAVFPPNTDSTALSQQFDDTLNIFGFSKAPEKDESGCIVTHLGFQFDSTKMEVRLPPNKQRRALQAVDTLLLKKSVTQSTLEEILGFLSHCCQVIPLGRPFLRQLFSLLRRKARYRRTRLTSTAKRDLRWWKIFLASWSSISLIQLSRPVFHVSTDASGLKGIGGVYDGRIFSARVPSRHRRKHINWKEMFAILHAFILWHKEWAHGSVDIASDSTAVVGGLLKKSIRGPAIRPLRTILLIAAVFNIEINVHWIPTEENIIADAASRHDFKKLADLGFKDQVLALRNRPSPAVKIATLRHQLNDFFISRLHHPQGRTMNPSEDLMKPTAKYTGINSIRPPLNPSQTGSPISQSQLNTTPLKVTSLPFVPSTSNKALTTLHLPTPGLNWSSKAAEEFMGIKKKDYASLSQPISCNDFSSSYQKTSTASISRQHSASALQASSDLVNSHGNHGITIPTRNNCLEDTFNFKTAMAQLPSHSLPQKQTPMEAEFKFISLPHHHHPSARSMLFKPSSVVSQPPQIPLHSPVHSVHFQKRTSLPKSENSCSEPVFRHEATLVTHSGRAQQLRQRQTAFQEKKLNSWDVGKAMPSTYTSTKYPNPLLPPIFSI
jgi:hypothetical protein